MKKDVVKNNYEDYDKNNNNLDEPIICYCSNELTIQFLIGRYKVNNESKHPTIEWKNGFLLDAIEKGKCVIFISIENASCTILERLNSLFDFTYLKGKRRFNIPEKGTNDKGENEFIFIHPNFRIIATCNNINKLSPAFLNRFDIIYLPNQLQNLDESKIKSYIRNLFNENKQEVNNEDIIEQFS